jgi:hypothetical protein
MKEVKDRFQGENSNIAFSLCSAQASRCIYIYGSRAIRGEFRALDI